MSKDQGLQMKYFVLKPKGDDSYAIASRDAMMAYADSVRSHDPLLASSLVEWVKQVNAGEADHD